MVDGIPQGFGVSLRHYRLAAGLTQDQLAERAGLRARGISDLERGFPDRSERF
jgi:transcriptional regulator with XRE-family HTH domain